LPPSAVSLGEVRLNALQIVRLCRLKFAPSAISLASRRGEAIHFCWI
jgi:hypothetical protein